MVKLTVIWTVATVVGMGVSRPLPALSVPPRACFRTAGEAVGGTGIATGGTGFFLESLRTDRMLRRNWATVRSCDHPERPGISIMAGAVAGEAVGGALRETTTQPAARTSLVVRAGAGVRVVRVERSVRIEVAGVAQSAGAVGERIRVQLVPVQRGAGDGAAVPQVVDAVVRSSDVLEMEP